MKIRILGAGWYGCSIAEGLIRRGHEVWVVDSAPGIFTGASGSNPARLHQGFHYPRSRLTRAMCQEHTSAFMARYGHLTQGIITNIYAIAEHDSLVDFGTYKQVLSGEVEYLTIVDPAEYGLRNVEGAMLTNERHIVVRKAREHFMKSIGPSLRLGMSQSDLEADGGWIDWEIDCTFCARDSQNIDRYEPCITALLEGPVDRAVTIMDGPFPSIYPWDESRCLSSLTSALHTPLDKCATYAGAKDVLRGWKDSDTGCLKRAEAMQEQMAGYWPDAKTCYKIDSYLLAIRAMPRSGADARLVDIIKTGDNSLRIRAGKIDAVIHAENEIIDLIGA